jgi:LysR family transcriptional activator of nhaA
MGVSWGSGVGQQQSTVDSMHDPDETFRPIPYLPTPMDWLNYHHLLYFWVVAREGSIARASEQLHLAQPTISGQIRSLEESFGQKLFARSGRGLVLTEFGRMVYQHADEIFKLGQELTEAVKGRPSGRPLRFNVGVADVMPKLVAYRLLEPALRIDEPVKIVCREDKPDRLLADLALHALDIVLADAPIGAGIKVKAFNHLLAECGVAFFAAKDRAAQFRKRFPKSLDGAPMLLPSEGTTMRRSLEQWFATNLIRPNIVGEFDDSALLKAFGQAGVGVFPAATIVADEVVRQFGVRKIGEVPTIRERFYAISAERKLKHPAVVAISETARQTTFG